MNIPNNGNNTDPIISINIIKFGTYIQMTTEANTKLTLIKYLIKKLFIIESFLRKFVILLLEIIVSYTGNKLIGLDMNIDILYIICNIFMNI
jgi:hypothetical protein